MPQSVEFGREVVEVEGDPVRLVGHRRASIIRGYCAASFTSASSSSSSSDEIGRSGEVDARFGRLAHQRADPRMGVLDVEDRIVLRRFDHLHEIEVERSIGPASQHHEAHNVFADLVDDVGKRHESPARFDIFTGSPARNSRTMLIIFTSRSTRPSVSAFTAACTRLTVPRGPHPRC